MPRRKTVAYALLLLAACERSGGEQEARALAAKALRNAVTYPQSSLVNVNAGDEAAEIVMTSAASVADIAVWYRQALPLNGWEVKSDQVTTGGGVAMYALRGERPLWITLRPNSGAPGTTYTLIGAITGNDSTARDSTKH